MISKNQFVSSQEFLKYKPSKANSTIIFTCTVYVPFHMKIRVWKLWCRKWWLL